MFRQTETTEQNIQPIIDPEVAAAFDLTQEDLETYSRQIIEMERFQKNMFVEGQNFYRNFAGSPKPTEIRIGELQVLVPVKTQLVTEIPDAINEEVKASMNQYPDQVQKITIGLRSFMEGFGTGALEEMGRIGRDPGRIQTAINAFDIATEGGIMQNPNIIEKLKNSTADNKTLRIDTVLAVQERINRRRGPKTIDQLDPYYPTPTAIPYRSAPPDPRTPTPS